MKNVSIENSPVGQKLAAVTLTKAIRGKFNLYPHHQAKGILLMSKEEGLDPVESVAFLEQVLPGMITEFLGDVRKLVEKEKGKTVRV